MQKNTSSSPESAKKSCRGIIKFSDPAPCAVEFVPAYFGAGPGSFALLVRGNSMEPEFLEGDTVIVDPDREVKSGDFVVVQNTLGQAILKQIVKDSGNVALRPLNKAYPVMDVTGQDFPFVGRVVERHRRVNSVRDAII